MKPNVLFIGGSLNGMCQSRPLAPRIYHKAPPEPGMALQESFVCTGTPCPDMETYVPMELTVGGTRIYVYVLIGIQEADVMDCLVEALKINNIKPQRR